MTMITINDIINEKNIEKSMEYLKSKPNSCGCDGMYLSELESYWEKNKSQIIGLIKSGKYKFGTIKQFDALQKNGKIRRISIYNVVDRLLLRAAAELLNMDFNEILCDCSFACRKRKGVHKAVEQAAQYIETGAEYIVFLDIKNYFDEIDHDLLYKQLQRTDLDEEVIRFITASVDVSVEYEDEEYKIEKGLVQGNPISPVLSNIYLNELDMYIQMKYIRYCRYCDDMIIFADSKKEAEAIYDDIKEHLSEWNLTINSSKSRIAKPEQLVFLGYRFSKDQNKFVIYGKESGRSEYYSDWHREHIRKIGSEYHMIEDGILTKKDFSILFQNKENKYYIPAEITDTINVYSNIIINSELLSFMTEKNIILNLFDKYSNYIGSYIPKNKSNGMILLKQSETYNNKETRLEYAKSIEDAAVHNICSNLKYYIKHITYNSEIISTEKEIRRLKTTLKEACSVDELLTTEAHIRKLYYSCFNDILPDDDFYYRERSKRPPKDAINALISFGNVYMYNHIAREIYKSQLDIRIAYIHSPMHRNENLNLDLAELFKPIIVDRSIFTLINKRMIDENIHFEKSGESVLLNKEGKRIFIEQLDSKMEQRIKSENRVITYRMLIRNEIKKLQNAIMKNAKYKPYKYY